MDSGKDKRNEGKKQTLTCAGPRPHSIRIQIVHTHQKKRTFHALHRQFVLENEGRRGGRHRQDWEITCFARLMLPMKRIEIKFEKRGQRPLLSKKHNEVLCI